MEGEDCCKYTQTKEKKSTWIKVTLLQRFRSGLAVNGHLHVKLN